jgi:hypothetical protein
MTVFCSYPLECLLLIIIGTEETVECAVSYISVYQTVDHGPPVVSCSPQAV